MLVSLEGFEVQFQGSSKNSGQIFETLWQSSPGYLPLFLQYWDFPIGRQN
jgi:hypothetical protein